MKRILDKQLKDLPKEVKFCKKCVISNQRPRISFNSEGVCSACEYSYRKNNLIDWPERERELRELCDKHRSSDGSFDVVIPSSGGKDSGYTAHLLKYEYGMHPLCVTWAPFIYTNIGLKNFNNFVKAGFNVIKGHPDGQINRKLARTAFELKGDHWEPFAFGQKAFAFHIAVNFKIPLIFYGENGEVEYGGSTKNADKSFESVNDWDELYFKGVGVDELAEEGVNLGILTKEEANSGNLSLYKAPVIDKIDKLNIQMHWLSYYKKWTPQENFYYAQKHTGFTTNEDGRSEGTYSKYASLDDKTDGFHFYLAFIKFGICRATSDAAHEIRDGHITREEGVALVHRYDGEFPKKYFKEFLAYLDISENYFWKVIDSYRSPHIWKKENGKWKLRHQVS